MKILDFVTGTGFFELRHIIILVICIGVLIAGSILSVKYIKVDTFNKILLGVGIVSESLKIITYILMNESTMHGYLPKTDLPFHLCSIQLILILILNLSKNDKLKHTIQAFMVPTCLIGGIAAIFIATSSSLNMPVITVQYFMFHTAISCYAIYLLANKEIKFTIKDYFTTLILLAVVFFAAIYINSILSPSYYNAEGTLEVYKVDVNFMYVVAPPQSGLPFLTIDYGWGVYIAHYVSLALIAVTATFIKPIIDFFKERRASKETSAK